MQARGELEVASEWVGVEMQGGNKRLIVSEICFEDGPLNLF